VLFEGDFVVAVVLTFTNHNVHCDGAGARRPFKRRQLRKPEVTCLSWPPYVIGGSLYFCPVVTIFLFLSIFFSSPNLSGRRFFHIWCGLNANLECMSEMCGKRLAENTGRKKVAKNRHLGTIAQLCRAISSQLRHVSTIGKKIVKQQYVLHRFP